MTPVGHAGTPQALRQTAAVKQGARHIASNHRVCPQLAQISKLEAN